LTFLCRLILDTLCCGLGLSAGAEGAFVSYLAAAGAGGGFDQFVADPEPQQFAVDVDITAGAGVMAADADLLPGHAHHAVGAHPAADPVCAAAVSLAARGMLTNGIEDWAVVNRWRGVAMSRDWWGRAVL
jgi:hypothetical protein